MSNNYGLNLDKEKADQRPDKDWVLLGDTLSEIELDNTVIKLDPQKIYDYLPIGELQKGLNDFMDCASRAPVNIAETIFNYAYANNLLNVQNVQWLADNDYLIEKDGVKKIEFSDRFIACMSGTSENGNSLKAPVDAIYKHGLIPKAMFKGNASMYRYEYLNANLVSDKMKELGKEFKRRFPIQYYKIWKHQFEKCLPVSPADVAGFAWPRPDGEGVYCNTGYTPNHAFMYFALPQYKIFDNYRDSFDGDWIKQLAPDYLLLEYGYWMVFRQRKLFPAPAEGTTIDDGTGQPKEIKKNAWLTFWEFWKAFFKAMN